MVYEKLESNVSYYFRKVIMEGISEDKIPEEKLERNKGTNIKAETMAPVKELRCRESLI